MINWTIKLYGNGICPDCEHVESAFLPMTCNAITCGMEIYDHPNFQLVLRFKNEEIARILNTLGLRVQEGERFNPGDYISGIYEDCDIRLDPHTVSGQKVLRIVIPDKYNRFPEEKECMEMYKVQLLKTEDLISV